MARKVQAINGRPLTGSMGLGQWSVSGRMRWPRPAASNKAGAFMAEDCHRKRAFSLTSVCPIKIKGFAAPSPRLARRWF
jgi:hypothetical protein